MAIDAPIISLYEKTGDTITVNHTPPVHGLYDRTVIVVRDNRGNQHSYDVSVAGLFAMGPLPSEITYSVLAFAITTAGEVSVFSQELRVLLSEYCAADTLGQNFPGFNPALEDRAVLSHEALGFFLEAVGFPLQTGKCLMGENIFLDVLPKEYYDQDSRFTDNPDAVVVLLQNEPGAPTYQNQRRPGHKQDSVVRVVVYSGNRERASLDASRLYRALLRRENVQFDAMGISVRSIIALDEPSLVGVDDTGWAGYGFRVSIRAIRTDTQH